MEMDHSVRMIVNGHLHSKTEPMTYIIKCECGNVFEPPEDADVWQCPECGHVPTLLY